MDEGQTDDATGFTPPYNISWATFLGTIEKVAGDFPNRIDRSYLGSQSGNVQTYLISAFRGFGLIREDGTVDDTLKQLARDADSRPASIAHLLRTHYPTIVSLGETNATTGELEAAFTQAFPRVTGESRKKAIRFYLSAASFAHVPTSRLWTVPKTASNGPRKARAVRRPSIPTAPRVEKPPGDSHSVTLKSGGTVSVNVSVNLFQLTREDREFVLGLIDSLTGYEPSSSGPG